MGPQNSNTTMSSTTKYKDKCPLLALSGAILSFTQKMALLFREFHLTPSFGCQLLADYIASSIPTFYPCSLYHKSLRSNVNKTVICKDTGGKPLFHQWKQQINKCSDYCYYVVCTLDQSEFPCCIQNPEFFHSDQWPILPVKRKEIVEYIILIVEYIYFNQLMCTFEVLCILFVLAIAMHFFILFKNVYFSRQD